MPKSLLDKLAGKGSVAGKLKQMRDQVESGEAESMHPTVGKPKEKEDNHMNSPDAVIRRGYLREDE